MHESQAERYALGRVTASGVDLSKTSPQFITSGNSLPFPYLHFTSQQHPAGEAPFRIRAVNEPWLTRLGYQRNDIVGATPKVLQGPGTELEALQALMAAVTALRGMASVRLLDLSRNALEDEANIPIEELLRRYQSNNRRFGETEPSPSPENSSDFDR